MMQLAETGMRPELAVELAGIAQEALLNPEQTQEAAMQAATISEEEMMASMTEKLKAAAGATGLPMLSFFLRGRLLPLFDMVSDVFVAVEISCRDLEDARKGTFVMFGRFVAGECDYSTEGVQQGFFWAVVAFFWATWVVLWLALVQVR